MFKLFSKKKKSKPYKPGKVTGLSSRSPRKRNRKRSIFNLDRSSLKKNIARVILTPFLILSSLLLIGALIQLVLRIREKPSINDDQYLEGTVIGFDDIPQFPQSEFIFPDTIEELAVQEFLSKGYSIYRLVPPKSYNDAKQFYMDSMQNFGWSFVQEVATESSTQKYGLYWQKEDEGTGVRIYNQINDIWYHKITDEQARTGLAEQVAYEKEIEKIIEDSKRVSLLPNYPWQLQLERDMTASYFSIENEEPLISEIFGITFRIKGESGRVNLFPVALYKGGNLERYMEEIEIVRQYQFTQHDFESLAFGSVLTGRVDPLEISMEDNITDIEEQGGQAIDYAEETVLPVKVMLLIHYDKKVVFLMEQYGENESSNRLWSFISTNLR